MNCQRCRAPLKLDSSLEDLNPAAYDLLVGKSSSAQSSKLSTPRPLIIQDRLTLSPCPPLDAER